MAIITGGNIVEPGPPVIEADRPRTTITQAVPTDALVGGGYRTPANAELAINVATGFVYERQAAVWVRIDTL